MLNASGASRLQPPPCTESLGYSALPPPPPTTSNSSLAIDFEQITTVIVQVHSIPQVTEAKLMNRRKQRLIETGYQSIKI